MENVDRRSVLVSLADQSVDPGYYASHLDPDAFFGPVFAPVVGLSGEFQFICRYHFSFMGDLDFTHDDALGPD
jgi:hypothetical protein